MAKGSASATLLRQGRVPVAPVLSLSSWAPSGRADLPILSGTDNHLLTTSGRAALALALRQLGVGAGDEVLVPAYHCPAMVGPVVAMGALPVFYRMQPDLSVAAEEFLRNCTPRTRAALFVHYFGILQDLTPMRELCDARGIALIEDCAHAFYGERDGIAVGRTGDFAIGSVMKFLPVFDGGCLVSYRHQLRAGPLRSPGLRFEMKAAVNIIERSRRYDRANATRAAPAGAESMPRRFARDRAKPVAAAPRAAEGGLEFEEAWADVRSSISTRVLHGWSDHQRVINRRRSLYSEYLGVLGSNAAGRAFYPELGPGMVPYVFPYLMYDPARTFDALWSAGIPLYRWEQVSADVCSVARDYRDRLIQFPCHQELSDAQIGWLLDAARRVVAS